MLINNGYITLHTKDNKRADFMKTKIKLLLVLSTFLFSIPLFAQQISTVTLENYNTIDGVPLQLNGAGIRSKYFINLYVASLYLPKKSTTLKSILNFPSVAIRLNIISSWITSKRMFNALHDGFEKATDGNIRKIDPQIKALELLLTSKIEEGDQFTLVANKRYGVTIYKNNKKQGMIIGNAFRIALLKIWLGKKPVQHKLKIEMLGL